MRYVLGSAILIAFAAAITGCSPTSANTEAAAAPKSPPEPAAKQPVIPVEAQYPAISDISEYYKHESRISADKRVDVTAQGMGTCLSVSADVGDTVSKGEVLAELDKEDVQAQLSQARIQLARMKNDLDRSKMLYEEGLGPRSQYENDSYAFKQQQATVEQQEIQLRNLTVRAPIGGIIISRNVQTGMYVSSGNPLFQIIDPNSFQQVIDVPEQLLARVDRGQAAKVNVDFLGDEELDATVTRIDPSVQQDGTVKVTLQFDQDARPRLKESAFSRVRLVLETHEDAVLVPKDAVIDQNGRKYVYALRRDEAEAGDGEATTVADVDTETAFVAKRVEVELGLEDSLMQEVLSGIGEHDLIVTLGQQTLKDGALVRVTNVEDELLSKIAMSAEEALERAAEERAKGAVTMEQRP